MLFRQGLGGYLMFNQTKKEKNKTKKNNINCRTFQKDADH